MTPFVECLHAEHKARLERFAQAAMRRKQPTPVPATPPAAAPPAAAPPAAAQPLVSDDQIREAHNLLEGVINKVEIIQRAVVARFPGVTLNDLRSARKPANVVNARQLAMYLCKELTGKSLPDIGQRFGGRDHTTVLHSIRKITLQIQYDQELSALVGVLKDDLSKGGLE
jgi:hypothetical protein